jgi:glutathione synthase/RimK-type ligase-like ATP-grasp enzyme
LRVAIATCAELPELGDDEPLLLEELRSRGIDAEPAVWDDPAIDWDRYELVVVRSTWDYAARRDEFVAWAESVPRLLNAPDVIRWNTDKRYLAELPAAVPTQFVEDGDSWQPPADEYVVKPAVSAGSRDTARYRPGEEHRAHAHVAKLTSQGRTVMIQPYLTSVDERGESAVIYFGGEYSHAICKGQMLVHGREPSSDLYLPETITARAPTEAELAIADETLDSLPWSRDQLLYARVDLIDGPDGSPLVIELELTEPSLFLSYRDGAAARLAGLVIQRL